MRDTIFAYSSGSGRAAISVLRISGSGSRDVVNRLVGRSLQPRKATFIDLRDVADGTLLDRCIVIWFPGPFSFTGDDCVEIHTHGGKAVKDRLLRCLESFPNLRAAEAGDFTRLAFKNGKLDLTEVEGLADLLEAKTEAQRVQALGVMTGSLSAALKVWHESIVYCLAMVEACIDFVDEEDVPISVASDVRTRMEALAGEISRAISDSKRREIVKEGFRVAVCGRPNVGKSSFINWLVGRELAIVTDESGTTRDLLEIEIDWNGFLLVFVDGAGIRSSCSAAETIGVERARQNALHSDLILWLYDNYRNQQIDPFFSVLENEIVYVRTKADLLDAEELSRQSHLCVSTKDGLGLTELLSKIGRMVADGADKWTPDVGIVNSRQRVTACDARDALQRAAAMLPDGQLEIVAEELRAANRSIAAITGKGDVEQVLDAVFSRFCIGK